MRLALVVMALLAGCATAPANPDAPTLLGKVEGLRIAGKFDASLAEAQADLPRIAQRYGTDSIEYAQMLSAEARVLCELGRYPEAFPLHEQAIALADKAAGPDDPRAFPIHRVLLEAYVNGGRPEDALAPSLALATKVEAKLGETSPETIAALVQQAYALDAVGKYAEARAIHERALPLATRIHGAGARETLEETNNFAMNYYYLSRYEDALAMFRHVAEGLEKLYGDEHPWVQGAYNNLATALQGLKHEAEAAEIMGKAYAVDVRTLGPNHPDTLLRLSNWAQMLADIKQTTQAAALLERAVAGWDATQAHDTPSAITARYNLAGAYADLGRIDEARAGYHAALDDQVRKLGPREVYTLYMETIIGRFERDNGRPAEALRLWDAMVDAIETLRAEGDLAPENRQSLFARWVQVYKESAVLRASQQDFDGALRLAELSKARTLLESSAMRAANETALPDAEARERVAALEAAVRDVDQRIAAETDDGKRVLLDTDKDAAVHAYADYRRTLAQRYPKYAALSDVKIVGREEGAALLAPGTRFVDFLVVTARNQLLVLVLDERGTLTGRVLGLKPGFAATVEAYRRLLSVSGGWKELRAEGVQIYAQPDGSYALAHEPPAPDARPVTELAPLGAWLSAAVLEPIADLLGDAPRLVISPDAALATLPLEALPFKGQPLVATREVSYVQSLSMLALLDARAKAGKAVAAKGPRGLLAMGGAQYGKAAAGQRGSSRRAAVEEAEGEDPRRALDALRGTWEALPGTEREVKRVSALFGKEARVYTGARASELTLRQLNDSGELARYRYLLFSTHGYLSVRVPQLSSVVLSQRKPESGTDGYVTAVEWPGYRLNSELLVLSACETGLGSNVQGEGVMGLPYALYVAGNRDTILSLWSVEDRSTEEFMVRFFSRLRRGESPAHALSRVKREFLGSKEFAAPAHWAPFVLYGGG